jgi:archaemetzincin
MMKHTLPLLAIALLLLTSCQNPAPPLPIKLVIKSVPVVVEKPQVVVRTIDLVPFAGTPGIMVKNLFERLKLIFPTITIKDPIPFPATAYYEPRNRYKADSLILFLSGNTPRRHISIGVTNRDISSSNPGVDDWGVIGLSNIPGNACVISSFRLNKSNLADQLFKVAIHELGHTQGLYHCENRSCFMRDAEGKNTTDQEKEFCGKCKEFLTGKGWIIQ